LSTEKKLHPLQIAQRMGHPQYTAPIEEILWQPQ
jgi:hypothetical protein